MHVPHQIIFHVWYFPYSSYASYYETHTRRVNTENRQNETLSGELPTLPSLWQPRYVWEQFFFFFFSDSFQQNYVSGIELDENPLQVHIMFGSAVIFLQLFKKDYRELFLIPQKQTKIFQRDYSQSFWISEQKPTLSLLIVEPTMFSRTLSKFIFSPIVGLVFQPE